MPGLVGDAMEENVDRLCQIAGELGSMACRFSCSTRPRSGRGRSFQQIARLSRGGLSALDSGSADRLKDLLGGRGHAAGGYRALAAYGEKKGGEWLRLTAQLRADAFYPSRRRLAIPVRVPAARLSVRQPADPARLARIVKWAGIVLASAGRRRVSSCRTPGDVSAPLALLLPGLRRLTLDLSGLPGPVERGHLHRRNPVYIA